jgi:MFS family permease
MSREEWRASLSLSGLYGLRMLGLFIILPVFAVYAETLPGGDSQALAGLAIGIYGLAQALLQIPFGWASDRYGRKPVMVVGLLIFAAGSFVAALATSIWVVILGRLMQGAGAISAVAIALTADLTRESQRSKAMAIIGSTIGLAFAVSLVVGPPLTARIGVEGLFTLTGVLALAALGVVRWLVPDPAGSAGAVRGPARGRLVADLAGVLADREMLRLNYGVLVLHAVLTALFLVVPVALRDAGLPVADHWHVYWPVLLASFVLMAPTLGWAERRTRVRGAFLGSIAITLASIVLLAAGLGSITAIAIALALFFTGFNLLEAFLPSLVSRLASESIRGTAIGVYSTIQFLGIFLGGAVGGVLAHTGGLGAVLAFASLLTAAWLAVALRMPPVGRPGSTTSHPTHA